MRSLIAKIVPLILIGTSWGQNNGGCEIDGIDALHWAAHTFPNSEIRDIDVLMKTFSYTGLLEISCSNCKYVKATAVDGVLTFTSTPEFQNFDRDQPPTTDPVALVYTDFTFTCKNGTSLLSFLQPVRDTNNNVPIFGNYVYEYNVVSPILPGGDITALGEQILVTDADFSNQDIRFTIEPPDSRFVIETVKLGNKLYRASITVSQALTLDYEIQFSLKATDSGTPSNSVLATVRIIKSNDCSVPPKFSQTYYEADYHEINGNAIIAIKNGTNIVVTSLLPIAVVIAGNDNFYATYDQTTGQIFLNALEVVRNAGTTVIPMELTAFVSGTNSGKCTILIYLPEPPKFSLPYYQGNYLVQNGIAQLTINDLISFDTQYQGTYTLSLSGIYADYFAITLVGTEIVVSLIREFESSILDNQLEVIITLEAILDSSDVGLSTLLIHLPQKVAPPPPTFSSSYYSARYINQVGMDVIEVTTGPIQVSTNRPDDLIVIVTGVFANYFGTKSLGNGVYQIFLVANLEDDVLLNNQYIVVTLEAFIVGESAKGAAPVVIACPQQLTRPLPLQALPGVA